jgi:hypothetical protein
MSVAFLNVFARLPVPPLVSTALVGCWLFVFLAASREVSLPLLLVAFTRARR